MEVAETIGEIIIEMEMIDLIKAIEIIDIKMVEIETEEVSIEITIKEMMIKDLGPEEISITLMIAEIEMIEEDLMIEGEAVAEVIEVEEVAEAEVVDLTETTISILIETKEIITKQTMMEDLEIITKIETKILVIQVVRSKLQTNIDDVWYF